MTKQNPEKNLRKAISVSSYAKINLFLEVLGRREDGYNELATVFSEIELHDKLEFHLVENGGVVVKTDCEVCTERENTVYLVADMLKSKFKVTDGVTVSIEKSIPIAAGLGGGSSNAAHAIKALNELWQLEMSRKEMEEVAKEIGSDVCFFLTGGTAIGRGRGDWIESIPDIELDMILLVKPEYGISSGEAYRLIESYGESENINDFILAANPKYCFNRLEAGLLKNYPSLRNIIDYINDNGALKSLVSGSGSTVIGLYDNEDVFDEHYNWFKDKGFWCCKTKTKRSTQ